MLSDNLISVFCSPLLLEYAELRRCRWLQTRSIVSDILDTYQLSPGPESKAITEVQVVTVPLHPWESPLGSQSYARYCRHRILRPTFADA